MYSSKYPFVRPSASAKISHHHVGNRGGVAHPKLDIALERLGLIRPNVFGVHGRVDVERGIVGGRRADVECLEEVVHPLGLLHAEAEAQALRLGRAVAAVDALGRAVLLLLIEGEPEESITRAAEARPRLERDPVTEDLHEAHGSRGLVECARHRGLLLGDVVDVGRDVDRGYGERGGRLASPRGLGSDELAAPTCTVQKCADK